MEKKDYVELRLYREDIRRAYHGTELSDKKCDELLKRLQEIHEWDGVISDDVIRDHLGSMNWTYVFISLGVAAFYLPDTSHGLVVARFPRNAYAPRNPNTDKALARAREFPFLP
jgi:hypothetical protein